MGAPDTVPPTYLVAEVAPVSPSGNPFPPGAAPNGGIAILNHAPTNFVGIICSYHIYGIEVACK